METNTTNIKPLYTTIHAMRLQIGTATILAVSGGRWTVIDENTIRLPVHYGYRVEVQYQPGSDLYTVRRLLVRGARTFDKGERDRVHAEDLAESVYVASCFRDPF